MIALIVCNVVFGVCLVGTVIYTVCSNHKKAITIKELTQEIDTMKSNISTLSSRSAGVKTINDMQTKNMNKRVSVLEAEVHHLQNAVNVFNNGFVVPTQSYMQ